METVDWICGAARASGRRGVMAEKIGELLTAALAGAGVETGAYDDRIIGWLAGLEPQIAAVIAGLITWAHQSGREAGVR